VSVRAWSSIGCNQVPSFSAKASACRAVARSCSRFLGGFGLLLSIVGVVGMTSYAVARRTREIGVRMAFGARADQVVRAMLIDSVWPIAVGVAIGVAGAWLSTGVIKSFLYETTPTDPGTLAAVALGARDGRRPRRLDSSARAPRVSIR
jgi:predicted lysophospholipase L1 biosynthesis ABC-type transport system permease subunit